MCMYYNLDENPGISQKEKGGAFKYSYLDDKSIESQIIDFTDGIQSSVTFYIPDMHCSSCVWLLENLYRINKSIISSKVNKSFQVYGRSQKIVQDPNLISKWKKAGMELLLIGLESIDQKKLDSMKKNSSPKINEAAIKICHKMGVEMTAYFIIITGFSQ